MRFPHDPPAGNSGGGGWRSGDECEEEEEEERERLQSNTVSLSERAESDEAPPAPEKHRHFHRGVVKVKTSERNPVAGWGVGRGGKSFSAQNAQKGRTADISRAEPRNDGGTTLSSQAEDVSSFSRHSCLMLGFYIGREASG